jgi:hypothetical protein
MLAGQAHCLLHFLDHPSWNRLQWSAVSPETASKPGYKGGLDIDLKKKIWSLVALKLCFSHF